MDDATATDNCGEVSIEVSSETTAGDCAGNYTITRTFTATDDCGNSSSATQTITVQDTTSPLSSRAFLPITRPSALTSFCWTTLQRRTTAARLSIEVSSETTAGDCAGNAAHDHSHVHSNRRLWQQQQRDSDDHGSRHDVPEFTSVPSDYTAECSDELVMDDAMASDNCGEVSIDVVSETTSGDCAGNYTITRTFTATDDCGNSSSSHSDDHGSRHDGSRAQHPS